MFPLRRHAFVLLAALALSGSALAANASNLVLDPADIRWETVSGPAAPMVQFHLRFRNSMDTPSEPRTFEVFAQDFGAFVPRRGMIAMGEIPMLQGMDVYDVMFEVPMEDLPPSAMEMAPGRFATAQAGPCPPDDHWDGNIDVVWVLSSTGELDGQVNKHVGTVQVCPGGGKSYIHLITGCPGDADWFILSNVVDCPAGAASFPMALVNEDFTPAPDPVPPGWTGWICVSAVEGVPVGETCCFGLTFDCAGSAATIDVCAMACECAVQADETTWGRVKGGYR